MTSYRGAMYSKRPCYTIRIHVHLTALEIHKRTNVCCSR
jgi:hypothetical protein